MSPPPASDDPDRTVLRGAGRADGVDSRFIASSSFWPHTLPEGTRLGGFEITGLIGEGGFGIVYLAWDPSLQRPVAIKEYMPASLASRASGSMEVSVKSERHRETFEAGLKSFVNEARLLARFDHPALVKVYRFWEANRTAYMVMPYYEGPTLKVALAERDAPPDEATLRGWLRPLLDALALMHREHCFHRDIAPDNILLTAAGPLLLDFGAARRVIGDMTQALTVVLKPGYAPIEQYGEGSANQQGAWTDLYALASVVHYAITGHAPMSSVERIMGDTLEPLAKRMAGRYSDGFLRAIDAALAVRPKDRPQDVAQFRALLDVGQPTPDPGFSPSQFDSHPAPLSTQPVPLTTTGPVTTGAATTLMPPPPREAVTIEHSGLRPVAPPASQRRVGLLFFGAALLALAIGLTWFALRPTSPGTALPSAPAEPASAVIETTPASEPSPAPAPAPDTTPVRAEPPAAPASSPTPVAVEPSTAPAGAEPAAPKAESPAVVVTPPQRPAAAAPRPATRPVPAHLEPRPARTEEVATPPKAVGGRSAKCSDILQKASLEPLSAEESAYLRSECR